MNWLLFDPDQGMVRVFEIAAKITYQNGALRETPKEQRSDCREATDAAVLPVGYPAIARKIADRRF